MAYVATRNFSGGKDDDRKKHYRFCKEVKDKSGKVVMKDNKVERPTYTEKDAKSAKDFNDFVNAGWLVKE